MTKTRKRERRHTLQRVDLGNAVGESDQALHQYYVDNQFLDMAVDSSDRRVFFLGDKGVGKSALLEMARRRLAGPKVIRLAAGDIGLGLLSNIRCFHELSLVDLGLLYRAVWDYVILISIVRKQFGTCKPPWWQRIVPGEEAEIYNLLQQTGELEQGSLKLSRAFVDILERLQVKMSASSPAGDCYGVEVSVQDKVRQDIHQMITEIRVLKHINRLRKALPRQCQHSRFYVIIDDLDDGWKNTLAQRECLKALTRSLLKLQHFPNVRFLVALRSVIFRQLQVDDPDKVRDHLVTLQWGKSDLQEIVLRRLECQLGRSRQSIKDAVLPENVRRMSPLNFMYAYLPRHPRSHIQFMQQALDLAVKDGQKRIRADDFKVSLQRMAEFCAEDLAFEYKTVYPGLASILALMNQWNRELSLQQMRKAVEDVHMEALERENDSEFQWVREISSQSRTSEDACDEVCRALIEVGALGVKRTRRDRPVYQPAQLPTKFTSKMWFVVSPFLAPPPLG